MTLPFLREFKLAGEVLFFVLASIAICAQGYGCSSVKYPSFESLVDKHGFIKLEGWIQHRGELILYTSKSNMEKHVRYPCCLSATFPSQKD